MKQGKLAAAVVAAVGMACLAMAPASGPTEDSQEAGKPTVAPKVDSASRPAARPSPAPVAVPARVDCDVALGDLPAKAFPDLDQVVDRVTRDLQRKIDLDAKKIERKLMRQSQFSLGP